MKNIRLVGMALLALFMSVSFSACGGSDDDDNNGGGGSSASIEGTWYLKSEKWFTDESWTKVSSETTYGDYANERVWTFKKSGNDLILTVENPDCTNEYTLVRNGNNDYQMYDDRFVVKTLTSNSLVVDFYDNYYDDDESLWEYGTYYFMK